MMAAMGSERYNLKGDAEQGRVELTIGDTIVEREFRRRKGSIKSNSEGYLEKPELADLFAFLLENNEARRAVAQRENLHEIITRPIDTDELNAEIDKLQTEKRQIDSKIKHIEERERELVDIE